MRLVDADFVLGRLKPYSLDDENWYVTGGTVIRLIHNAIDDAPTINAVPVVRCRECKHRDPEDKKCDCGCWHFHFVTKDDDFCSMGERRSDD